MENLNSAQPNTPLEAYLSDKKILIVDPNERSRNNIARILIGLGAQTPHISLVPDFDLACEIIHQEFPEVVITEYTINKGNGLDLAHEFNKIKLSTSLFIIFTANSLQANVSEAAEEDVDLYILKPYSTTYFIQSLSRAVHSKLNPSDYIRKINNGKKLLVEKSWDDAIEWFNHAIENSARPSLAYYYRSQAEIQKLLYDIAEQSLRSGLQFNEVHYKCLTSLFDLLQERGKLKEAYELSRKLISFPLNSKRLSKVIELAVRTTNYSDIDKYYDVVKEVEVEDQELMKHISAALVVSSKILFQRGEMYKAASYLKKASISASGRPGILLEVVATLAINDFIPNAKEALSRFPRDTHDDFHYQVACAMIAHYDEGNSSQHVTLLRNAIEEGASEAAYYYWTIAFLKASKQSDLADEYMARALNIWPNKMEYFQKALRAVPPR